jgi:hypothetical protein
MCKRWLGRYGMHRFAIDILRHLGPRPTTGRWYIDRIDNNKGYVIKNLRWATSQQSAANKRPRRKRTDAMTNVSVGMLSNSSAEIIVHSM